ncbi:hypothetical protein VP01_822g3 [Puccinia sorghi]|uniref:Cytochrome b5 heme-binding domain-containing protein n=1 Tax=Puccinia sorghi TaxID=27349 RepID=A0A0L6UC35_9BASI|nr:hypothetical protein VP01_822g3 [Puccinia sorghi]
MLLTDVGSIISFDQLVEVLGANKLWLCFLSLNVTIHLLVLSVLTLWALTSRSSSTTSSATLGRSASTQKQVIGNSKKMTQDPVRLDPPKDTPFTANELSQFDGSDVSKPIYVAIKGCFSFFVWIVFDVSGKREVYGPGGSYHVFAGKDGSKGLGKSSLKAEDAVADYSSLTEEELKVLDDWVVFFKKRYNIIGKVTPTSTVSLI